MKTSVRILVVDNDPDIRTDRAHALECAGYTVLQAANGGAALEICQNDYPDLILLDRDLSDRSGLDVCRQIKAIQTGLLAFVILISDSHVSDEHPPEQLETGADGDIVGPIEKRELLARVEDYLRILQLTRSLRRQAQEMEDSNEVLRRQRLASLNLMEDAMAERDRAEQANQALRQGEEQFRSLVDGAPDAIFVQLDQRFAYVNDAACTLLGATCPEQLLNTRVLERLHPEARQRISQRMHDLNARKISVPPVEEVYLRLDGTAVPVEVSAVPILYQGQQGALVFVRDIAERRQTEHEMAALARFLSENPNPVLRIASNGTILAANQSSDPLLEEWQCEESRRLPEQWRKVVEMALEMGTIKNVEVHCASKVFALAFVPVQGTGYVNIYGHDISRSEELKKERKRLAMAVEYVAEGIVLTNPEGIIEYVNPAFERITGYSRREAIGCTPRILKSGKQDSAFYRDLWQTISSGRHWRGHLINKRKDGTFYTEDASISPIRDESGAIMNYVSVKNDITDRMALESHLRQTQKLEAIGTLASGIAHDFNNALAAILGYTSVVAEELGPDSPFKADLDQVLAASNRAKELVRQILTFSRKVEQERQPVVLHLIVKETILFLCKSLPANIEIKYDDIRNSGTVLADPTQVSQIVMNLSTNAFHAMQETGGMVIIRLEPIELDAAFAETHPSLHEGPYVRLSVIDTGHGMSKDLIGKIFDPFFTTKEPGEGTGLGLATTYGIVNAHGGAITVYSEVDMGSTFSVYFPRLEEDAELKKKEKEPIRGGNERILVVDDEPPLAQLMDKVLKQFGYMTMACTESAAALDTFRGCPHEFDLVVSDYAMPGMNGLELARAIRGIRPDMPVILCTGYQFFLADGGGDDIVAILPKPSNIQETAKTIRTVLDQAKKNVGRGLLPDAEKRWSLKQFLSRNQNREEDRS